VSENTFPTLRLLRMSHAVINEPRNQTDAPIKFTAGLILTIKLDAFIYNVKNVKNIRLKIHFADQQTNLVLPPSEHFRLLESDDPETNNYRLNTKVYISHGNWTEPCLVDIGLVSRKSSMRMSVSQCWASKTGSGLKQKPEESLIISLCKPVQMLVAPTPQRRNLL